MKKIWYVLFSLALLSVPSMAAQRLVLAEEFTNVG